MTFIDKIKKGIQSPKVIIIYLFNKLAKIIPDEKFLQWKFRLMMGQKLDLENPKTFNEKLQWLKLNNRRPEYTKMVDKVDAKEYVASIIGKEYIIPTLGVYSSFEEIDFDKLPNQFVLKCTHDSGCLIVCKDKSKLDKKAAKRLFDKGLKRNFYYQTREWPYKNVKPRIIAEKYMAEADNGDLKDYKFFCFNGKVKVLKIDFDRFIEHRANYFDRELNLLPFGEVVCPPNFNKKLERPENFDKMLQIAETISSSIPPFVRVDLYNSNGKIYFGEITFYPASGMGKFTPEEWDEIFGDWLDLNKN